MADEARVEQFLAGVQRDLNCITDADRSTRRRAFDTLTKRCAAHLERCVCPSKSEKFRDTRESADVVSS